MNGNIRNLISHFDCDESNGCGMVFSFVSMKLLSSDAIESDFRLCLNPKWLFIKGKSQGNRYENLDNF